MAVNDVQQPQPAAYKAKKVDGTLPEYDAMRARLQQRSNADTQQQQDAMQRRFASQGALNSGAAIKQQQLVAETGVQTREQGLQEISGQESAEKRRLNEAESNKEFQSQEAATARSSTQSFTANESRLGREQQQGQFDADLSFRDKVNTWQQSAAMQQLDMAAKEMLINTVVAGHDLNKDERNLTMWALNNSPQAFQDAQKQQAAAQAKNDQKKYSASGSGLPSGYSGSSGQGLR